MSVVSNDVFDAREAEFTIFGLQGVNEKGECNCGNPDCKALYKHPIPSNWGAVPFYSSEQFDVMCEVGHLATGYGILTKGLMVIDVDARNGGVESFKRLCDDLKTDFYKECAYVVLTGSGGGSMHLYFKSPIPPKALMQHHELYKGIDFKCNSGFVVGAGSMHKSGNRYEVDKGYPQDLTDMPPQLLLLLEKKTQYRSTDLNGETVDIEVEELNNIVSFIDGNDQYQRWVDVGMAIHDTTQGSMQGLAIWDAWSQKAENYESGQTATKWAGFGKGASLLSLGTLMHYAKENGYVQSVTFNVDVYHHDEPEETTLDDRVAHIDIRKPPKFAGQLCDWINAQCRYPRENLAAAASLYVLSCIGGMRHSDARDDLSLNFIAFNVAGSGTGKDAIDKAIKECFDIADITQASYGEWKSTQEAVRNLIEHQASFYNIDELGEKLAVVSNAKKRGGAVYLEGLIGFFMSAYTKYDSTLSLSGDVKRDLKEKLFKSYAQVSKKMDDTGETPELLAEQEEILQRIKETDKGIVNPYLSMFGLTAPNVFESLVDRDMATNGFIARAAIFREHETNPRIKKGFKSQKMPMHMQLSLAELYTGGETTNVNGRVERMGNKQSISTTQEASEMLDEVYEYFYEMAEMHKSRTGMEAIPRRGWEICSKISLLTAMPSKTRTIEDVMYGFAVAKWDIQKKIELAYSNEAEQHKDTRADALMVKIKSMLDKDSETTAGQIRNRLREFTKEDVDKALEMMTTNKMIVAVEHVHKVNKTVSFKYKLK